MRAAKSSPVAAPSGDRFRVLQVVPAIARQSSGPSYSVVRLCESIRATGVDVRLAALDWSPLSDPPDFLYAFPLGVGPRRLGRSPKMREWLIEQAKTAAVIHNHGTWQMNSVYPAVAARRAGVPLVTSPRGSYSQWAMNSGSAFKRLFWPLLQEPAVKRTALFHATSDSEYEDIRRLGFRQPVAVIPNGIDLRPAAERLNCGRRELLFLGRVHKVKGLDLLLSAWQRVEAEFADWDLVIAGSDDGYHGSSGYLDQMRQLAETLQLQRVRFLGEVHGERKQTVFASAELFVLPSHSENFGIAVAEALSCGTPAIVSHGAPWAGLENHGAGWHIPIGVSPLVECLRTALLYSPTRLEAMGLAGRIWMQRDFAWPVLGPKMLSVYRWLTGEVQERPDCVRVG